MPTRTAPPGGACGCAASPHELCHPPMLLSPPPAKINKNLPGLVSLKLFHSHQEGAQPCSIPKNQSREGLLVLVLSEGGDPPEPLGDITHPLGMAQDRPMSPVLWAPALPAFSTIPLEPPAPSSTGPPQPTPALGPVRGLGPAGKVVLGGGFSPS